MRLAAIDLGTNTVHLLVGDAATGGPWHRVHHDQQVTRLGEGLWPGGVLRETPMTRTGDVVAAYVDRARALGATRVRIVATSAVREAINGREFALRLEGRTGVVVEIASGEEEARLTVRGVLEGLGQSRGTLLVFDIGGGSTEYILARDRAILAHVSLRLGVVPLAERFPFPAAVDPDRYREMEDAVLGELRAELPHDIRAASIEQLVGTAGTVTTLAALDLGLAAYDGERVQGHRLTRAAVERQLARLGALAVHERAALPCLEPGRADLIVPGTGIVLATMRLLGADVLVVSDAGLREGMMSETVTRIRGDQV